MKSAGKRFWVFVKWVLVMLRLRQREIEEEANAEEAEEVTDVERELKRLHRKEKILGIIVKTVFLAIVLLFFVSNNRMRRRVNPDAATSSKLMEYFKPEQP